MNNHVNNTRNVIRTISNKHVPTANVLQAHKEYWLKNYAKNDQSYIIS